MLGLSVALKELSPYLNIQNMEVCEMIKQRCGWVGTDPLYIKYHDEEWGVPLHCDTKLFQFLLLEGAQAGLSWITILRKRDNFKEAFDNFDAEKISVYDSNKVEDLLKNKGIIRNRRKIVAAIANAKCFLKVQKEFGSFDRYIWEFVGGKPIINYWEDAQEVPVYTHEAVLMSKDLSRRGFSFVGPTICYSFMQAAGMVNDHLVNCFRHNIITGKQL